MSRYGRRGGGYGRYEDRGYGRGGGYGRGRVSYEYFVVKKNVRIAKGVSPSVFKHLIREVLTDNDSCEVSGIGLACSTCISVVDEMIKEKIVKQSKIEVSSLDRGYGRKKGRILIEVVRDENFKEVEKKDKLIGKEKKKRDQQDDEEDYPEEKEGEGEVEKKKKKRKKKKKKKRRKEKVVEEGEEEKSEKKEKKEKKKKREKKEEPKKEVVEKKEEK